MSLAISAMDERVPMFNGGKRTWWDVDEQRLVTAATLYVPFGCPDWGETEGARNELCTFCALPNAVTAYRVAFYGGAEIPANDHVQLFKKTLAAMLQADTCHTLMVFNAGSFLAMPSTVQSEIMREITKLAYVKRVVIEARAPLITHDALIPLLTVLSAADKKLTVRVGVETKDDHLRLKVLKKGHSARQLKHASDVMRELGVTSGGYALLNPAPGLDPQWAVDEAIATLDWILDREQGLGMDEAYFGPTCVGEGSVLAKYWENGEFAPASLNAVFDVLTRTLPRYEGRIHLLPFADTPPFLAVPSNHVKQGLPESLDGAQGCDRAFHSMFQRYRETADRSVLHPVACTCHS